VKKEPMAGTAEGGRPRQRRRTRNAILRAATELLQEAGDRGEPSMVDIADRADVSRRTVYLYFPTLEQLLLDATLGVLSDATVARAFEPSELSGDAYARLDRLVAALSELSAETMPLGRTLIRLTVEHRTEDDGSTPRRGYRRVEWIEAALAPLREQVDEPSFQRLVSALAMILGWEGLIVLRDVRGLEPPEEEQVVRWAAKALLDATLADAAPAVPA
jgi:AcrR family transcriptional regulator